MTARDETEAAGAPGEPAEEAAPRRRSRRLPPRTPDARRCMVLGCTVEDTPAVDLDTGALLRLRIDWGSRPRALTPFDVVDAQWAEDPEQDDQAQPEAVTVAGIPERLGTCRGRRVRAILRALTTTGQAPLLGFPGTSAPYWEFDGMRPSVAVVAPSRGPVLFRRRRDDTVWARFGWNRSDNWLPLEDRHAVDALDRSRRERLAGKDLAGALGFRPNLVVVALSRPRDGHCYKTVAALLPRP